MHGVLIGTINLYLIRKVQDVSSSGTTCEGPLMRVRLCRSTCRGPLMRVRLWRSTFVGEPLHPAQANPLILTKWTPLPCPSEPLHPAKANPLIQPKWTPSPSQSAIPSLVLYTMWMSTPHHASCRNSYFSLHAMHGIQSEGGNIFEPGTNLFLPNHCKH